MLKDWQPEIPTYKGQALSLNNICFAPHTTQMDRIVPVWYAYLRLPFTISMLIAAK